MKNKSKTVFLLQHSHKLNEDEESDFIIGIYSTKKNAKEAIDRLKHQPGFQRFPRGFHIDSYKIDEDNWTEGFCTIVTLYMPIKNKEGDSFSPVHAALLKGSLYEIVSENDSPETEIWLFNKGDVVKCRKKKLPDGFFGHIPIEKIEMSPEDLKKIQ